MLNKTYDIVLQALGAALFNKKPPQLNNHNVLDVIKESKAQAVFTCVYPVLKEDIKRLLSASEFNQLENEFLACIANNFRVNYEHAELHNVMQKHNIPYVILKGCASSVYYSEPDLRTMGDVDFLVHEKDLDAGIEALESIGFKRDQYEFTTNQSAYLREPNSVWEIHKSPTGIPNDEVGDIITQMLSDMIETSRLYEKDGLRFYIPDVTHHGIVLLLHKASHMATSGIGLRHLCDWAVFESSFTDSEFCELFEEKLQKIGLWRFAQVMTLLCKKYLGAPKKNFSESCDITDDELDELMLDIFFGGNFGGKDKNRYRQTKYITDREKGTIGKKGLISQFFKSLNDKVYSDYKFIDKCKVFLPLGWIMEAYAYMILILRGKRKSEGTIAMLKEASKRKEIYNKLHLYEVDC